MSQPTDRQRPERFPMQDGPPIDWQAAEAVYAMYADLYGRSQSLERIAQRGGFGWAEVAIIAKMHRQRRRRP